MGKVKGKGCEFKIKGVFWDFNLLGRVGNWLGNVGNLIPKMKIGLFVIWLMMG